MSEEGIYQQLEICQSQRDALREELSSADQKNAQLIELIELCVEDAGIQYILGSAVWERLLAAIKPNES